MILSSAAFGAVFFAICFFRHPYSMNNSNGLSAPQSLPPLTQLIKPEQIANVPNFNEALRTRYMQGITNLWATVRSHPEDSPEHQNAHKKLAEVTTSIREHLRKAAMTASANGNRPANSGQPAQDVRAQGQQPIQPNQEPKSDPQLSSQRIANSIAHHNILIPPGVSAQGQEKVQNWLREAKQRYALQAQNYEKANTSIRELMAMLAARQREGRPLTQEESQQLAAKKLRLESVQSEAREFIMKFRNQQEQIKQQLAARDPQADGGNPQDSSMDAMEGATDLQPSQQPTLSEHQGHKDVNSALDAARQQAGSAARNASSPPNNKPAQTAGHHGTEPTIKKEPQASQPSIEVNTSGPPIHHNSPQVGQPNSQAIPPQRAGPPFPLSHRDAMQAAQSYSSQPNYQQPSSQPPTHGHPQLPNRGDPPNNNVKMPIPKDLKIPPPQPVSMGPARPTLTGGPSNGAMGQLGQPAIQKHPGYVLEGDGERVLSKKKLQELVRQVTGVGSEGDDTEGLTPEVEEVSYPIYSSDRRSRHNHHPGLKIPSSLKSHRRPSSKSPMTSSTKSSAPPASSQNCAPPRPSRSATCNSSSNATTTSASQAMRLMS